MKFLLRLLLFVVAGFLVFSAFVGGYFYFAIWVPNRALGQSNWTLDGPWDTPPETIRSVCHHVLSHRWGNHHNAFLALEHVGTSESIPYLIRALQWQSFPASNETFMVCTTGHCLMCLRKLTGHNAGNRREDWELWWKTTGSKLPLSAFPLPTNSATNSPEGTKP